MTAPIRKLLRELATAVLADREDAAIVRPVLMAYLTSSLADFERYFDVRHARNRVRDHDILMAREKAKRAGERADNAEAVKDAQAPVTA